MDTKQEIIRRYFRENDSERKIARDLQINRKTVKKYLKDYLKAKEQSDKEGSQKIIQDYSGSSPEYDTSGRSRRKLTDEIAAIIRDQIDDNERKKREGLRKQIKRKINIHEYLLSQGHRIGYTTICNYIRDQVRIPAIPDTYSWFNRTLSPDLNGHLVLRKPDSSFISLFRINICYKLIVFIYFSH